jgi:hypothetical protein
MAHKGYSNKAKSGAHAAAARMRQAAERAKRERATQRPRVARAGAKGAK